MPRWYASPHHRVRAIAAWRPRFIGWIPREFKKCLLNRQKRHNKLFFFDQFCTVESFHFRI